LVAKAVAPIWSRPPLPLITAQALADVPSRQPVHNVECSARRMASCIERSLPQGGASAVRLPRGHDFCRRSGDVVDPLRQARAWAFDQTPQ